jgi:hypothetical protein
MLYGEFGGRDLLIPQGKRRGRCFLTAGAGVGGRDNLTSNPNRLPSPLSGTNHRLQALL